MARTVVSSTTYAGSNPVPGTILKKKLKNKNKWIEKMIVTSSAKTMKFDFIPTERSAMTIKNKSLDSESLERYNHLTELKDATDIVFKEFIEKELKELKNNIEFPINELINALININEENDKKDSNNVIKYQKICFEKTANQFKKYVGSYKKIFERVCNINLQLKELYTTGYYAYVFKSRDLMFATGKNSIAYRIFNDNIKIFVNNLIKYNKFIQKTEYITFFQDENLNKFDYLQNCIIQSDIDKYNNYIGQLNKEFNEFCQKNKLGYKKFEFLNKQILGNSEYSLGFDTIKNFEECDYIVRDEIQKFKSNIPLIVETINLIVNNLDSVFIKKKSLVSFVHKIKFDIESKKDITEIIKLYAKTMNGDSKNEFLKKDYFSINELKKLFYDFDITNLLYFDYSKTLSLIDMYNAEKYFDSETYKINLQLVLNHFNNIYNQFKLFNNEFVTNNIYNNLDIINNNYKLFTEQYNKIRNFINKSNKSYEQYKIDFKVSSFGEGFTKDLAKKTFVLKDKNDIYLGCQISTYKIDFENNKSNECFERYYKDNFKMQNLKKLIPMKEGSECFEHFKNSNEDFEFNSKKFIKPLIISKELFEKYNKKDKKAYVDIIVAFFSNYKGFEDINWKEFIGEAEQYKSLKEIDKKVEEQTIKLNKEFVSKDYIYQLEKEEHIILGKIYCKDFSDKSKGIKNRDALILLNAFSDEGIKNGIYNICTFNLFKRPISSSIEQVIHKQGSIIVDKKDRNGNHIPNEIYKNIYTHYNNSVHLNVEAKELIDNGLVKIKQAYYDIVKDKRFAKDSYKVHIAVSINKIKNPNANGYKNINKDIICSIDRGERNLLSYTIKNYKTNEILAQNVLNTINNINYSELLKDKEKTIRNQKKTWQTIDSIKNIKKAYCGDAAKHITDLCKKYNCMLAIENLDMDFVRKRQKIEKNVYQTFENMLFNMLECNIDKNDIFNVKQYLSMNDKKQVVDGIVITVNPSYTSAIDINTGFISNFRFNKYNKINEKKEFFNKFDEISFNGKYYVFKFDYNKFKDTNVKMNNGNFTLTSEGERIVKSKVNNHFNIDKINLTDKINEIFKDYSKTNLKEIIQNNSEVCKQLFDMFKIICQLRNSDNNNDYIYSPAIDKNGNHYDTRNIGLYYNADLSASENIGMKAYLKMSNPKLTTTDYLNYFKP